MHELKDVIDKIEEMKEYLLRLMELKHDITDPDVIAVSKMLDIVLNEYYELTVEKTYMRKRA